MDSSQGRLGDIVAATTDQRIDKEAAFVAKVRSAIQKQLPRQRLAEMADDHQELAQGYLDAAQSVEGRQRMTLMWLGGHHAFQATLYAEAARAA